MAPVDGISNFTLAFGPVKPGTLSLTGERRYYDWKNFTYENVTGTDDGVGNIVRDGAQVGD